MNEQDLLTFLHSLLLLHFLILSFIGNFLTMHEILKYTGIYLFCP